MAEGLPPPDGQMLSAFEFLLSQPAREIHQEYRLTGDVYAASSGTGRVAPRVGSAMERFEVNGRTPVEQRGTKRSQRTEVRETRESASLNRLGDMIWYGWSIYLDPSTLSPDEDAFGQPAKLHLGQFHQRGEDGTARSPALMINLTTDGDLIAQFERAVGKRAYTLVSGGQSGDAAKGQWIDILVGARWSDMNALTEIRVRRQGERHYQLVARDDDANTSTGRVFFKYGVYRSFTERDPALERSRTVAYFDGVRRGVHPGQVMLPPAAPATSGLELDWGQVDWVRGD
jgi:hypothetical protein